jgi:hypothetical protein
MTLRITGSACVLVLALLVGGVALVGCRSKEPTAPEAVSDASDAALKAQFHVDEVFTLAQSDGTYRVLVFKLPKASAPDSDYRVVFYRRQGDAYVRHGAEMNIVNFERPRLNSGPPARIETAENRLGVTYYFVVDAKGVDIVPATLIQ